MRFIIFCHSKYKCVFMLFLFFFLLLYCTWAENCVRVLRFLSELHHKKAQAIILNSDSNFLLAHGKQQKQIMIDWEDFRATKAAYNIKNILEEHSINYITINVYRFSITIKKIERIKKIVEGEASSNIILLTKCSTYARECAMSFRFFSLDIFTLFPPSSSPSSSSHCRAEQNNTKQTIIFNYASDGLFIQPRVSMKLLLLVSTKFEDEPHDLNWFKMVERSSLNSIDNSSFLRLSYIN